jgi:endoglucanase
LVVLGLAVAATVIVTDRRESSGYHGNPFSGVQLFVDPHSPAAQAARSIERSDPAAAVLLRKIASQPAGIWLGTWIPVAQVAASVQAVMGEAAARGAMPLFVLYAFPYRGCGRDASIRVREAAVYERWIGQVAAGIGTGKAAVILEPDALAQFFAQPGCLSPSERRHGLVLMRRTVDRLVRLPDTAVYLDAGHSRWRPAQVMAPLLLAAGVRKARGFSLNVSNFNATAAEESYGDRLSALVHGAHYVVDTSRNGAATARTWCNPPGQALGVPPTAKTGNRLVDALLWIKPPGASDGPCHGGPPAGMFWVSYALGLAANARW